MIEAGSERDRVVWLGHRLAALVGGTSPVTPPPEGWDPVVHQADQQRLVPALWLAASRCQLIDPVPPELRVPLATGIGARRHPAAVMEQAYLDNRVRNDDLIDQFAGVLDRLSGHDIEVVPLKGIDALTRGWAPDPGWREQRDLDVLVPRERAEEAWDLLVADGYQVVGPPRPHHLAPLRDPTHFGSIELHTAPVQQAWREALTADDVWARASTSVWRDRPVRRLTATDATVLFLVHAHLAGGSWARASLDLRGVLDVASVPAAEVDWDAVRLAVGRVGATHLADWHQALAGALLGLDGGTGRPPDRVARRRLDHALAMAGDPRAANRAAHAGLRLQAGLDRRRLARHYDLDPATGAAKLYVRHARARLGFACP